MFSLAAGKAATGRALDNPVLRTEGRVTAVDGILAVAVLLGLLLNAALGWWWADPAAGYVLVYYAAREVREILSAVTRRLRRSRRPGRVLVRGTRPPGQPWRGHRERRDRRHRPR
jgi:divalent metal cation (Fe/Co/Zn/Cd) transporter